MLWRGMLADLCAVVHAAYFSFVVLGLVAILMGIAFRWSWVRNPWFRSIHIAMIGIVVVEANRRHAVPFDGLGTAAQGSGGPGRLFG